MTERVLYESSNGDVWALTRDPRTNTPVKHQPNISSGGQVSYMDIGQFLRSGAGGPERQQLLKLIDTDVLASAAPVADTGEPVLSTMAAALTNPTSDVSDPLDASSADTFARAAPVADTGEPVLQAGRGSAISFVAYHVSRNAREKLSRIGFMMYSKKVRSPVLM
ncbi:hypothetical protein [Bradyrhizobium sp. BWC-3-1]|uniref:hypothetical protein n=1 Tax=Bradyrhizobium sp. BWC-3-1 TaxID=3080012 RepID=UPI00293E878F|nr:hypothetical protein [Bradyrhizobium sp. BWC-3-1]WOH60170.1 hypothetical protein RX329_08675 [Bradyrhizobium sp. BWC-3-1]